LEDDRESKVFVDSCGILDEWKSTSVLYYMCMRSTTLGKIKYTLLTCLRLTPGSVSFRWLLEISKDKNHNLPVE